jgi:hypothetical protein
MRFDDIFKESPYVPEITPAKSKFGFLTKIRQSVTYKKVFYSQGYLNKDKITWLISFVNCMTPKIDFCKILIYEHSLIALGSTKRNAKRPQTCFIHYSKSTLVVVNKALIMTSWEKGMK